MYAKEQLAIEKVTNVVPGNLLLRAYTMHCYPRNKHVNKILAFADISRYSYEIPQKREMCNYLIVESVFIIGSQ